MGLDLWEKESEITQMLKQEANEYEETMLDQGRDSSPSAPAKTDGIEATANVDEFESIC